jgi:hypothetical protein
LGALPQTRERWPRFHKAATGGRAVSHCRRSVLHAAKPQPPILRDHRSRLYVIATAHRAFM